MLQTHQLLLTCRETNSSETTQAPQAESEEPDFAFCPNCCVYQMVEWKWLWLQATKAQHQEQAVELQGDQ